jgi:hypothetical protein
MFEQAKKIRPMMFVLTLKILQQEFPYVSLSYLLWLRRLAGRRISDEKNMTRREKNSIGWPLT